MSRIIIIGGDSFLGKALNAVSNSQHDDVWITSRRLTERKNEFYLDLLDVDSFITDVNEKFDIAVLLAGVWDYKKCSEDPSSKTINVFNIVKLADYFINSGVKTVFVSSNTVFGGDRAWCNEYDEHEPKFPYAQHKSLAEKELMNLAGKSGNLDLLKIVRFTKILDVTTPPIPVWMSKIDNNEILNPFSDLVFAPVSLSYAANSLYKIIKSSSSGIFHVSGSRNINYYDFLVDILEFIDSRADISTTTSKEAGVHIPFLPKYSGIGMKRTTELTGIEPQDIDDVIRDLFNG